MADETPAREWHKVEFLTPGRLVDTRVHKTPVLDHLGEVVGVHLRTEYTHQQEVCGVGYYVVEGGVIVGHADEAGRELDMTRIHECRLVPGGIYKECPWPTTSPQTT